MVRANILALDENALIRKTIKDAVKSKQVNEYIKISGIMPVFEKDMPQPNLKTGRLLRSADAQDDLVFHSRKINEKEAAIYIWNHPEKMRFVRLSPLGEVKKMNTEKDIKNIRKKKKRGAIGYNQYEFTYRKKKYLIKLEIRKKGFEVPYHLERKRT